MMHNLLFLKKAEINMKPFIFIVINLFNGY